MRFCCKSPAGLRNRVDPNKMEEADYQVSKGSHHAGSVSGPDPGGVYVEGDVAHIVQPVLNAPVIAV